MTFRIMDWSPCTSNTRPIKSRNVSVCISSVFARATRYRVAVRAGRLAWSLSLSSLFVVMFSLGTPAQQQATCFVRLRTGTMELRLSFPVVSGARRFLGSRDVAAPKPPRGKKTPCNPGSVFFDEHALVNTPSTKASLFTYVVHRGSIGSAPGSPPANAAEDATIDVETAKPPRVEHDSLAGRVTLVYSMHSHPRRLHARSRGILRNIWRILRQSAVSFADSGTREPTTSSRGGNRGSAHVVG